MMTTRVRRRGVIGIVVDGIGGTTQSRRQEAAEAVLPRHLAEFQSGAVP
jgi:hypothetical protein